MSLTRYKYFEAVARLGSIREASEALHVAPSAVSRQISQLEYDFNIELFERYARGMVLTEAGRILLVHARGLLDHVESAKAEINDLQGMRRGQISIWTIEGLVRDFVVPVISDFQEAFPGMIVKVEAASTESIASALAEDEADIGILFDPENLTGLEVAYEFPDPLQIAMRPDNPAAEKSSIDMSDLCDLRLALPNRSFGIRRLFDQAAAAADIGLTPVMTTGSIAALRSFAQSGSGVSLLTRLSVQQELALGHIKAVPLSIPGGRVPMVRICTRRNRHPTVATAELLEWFRAGLLSRNRNTQ